MPESRSACGIFALRACASWPLHFVSVTLPRLSTVTPATGRPAMRLLKNPSTRRSGEMPATLLEYLVYALGLVILCAVVAAFYFIGKPMAFNSLW